MQENSGVLSLWLRLLTMLVIFKNRFPKALKMPAKYSRYN